MYLYCMVLSMMILSNVRVIEGRIDHRENNHEGHSKLGHFLRLSIPYLSTDLSLGSIKAKPASCQCVWKGSKGWPVNFNPFHLCGKIRWGSWLVRLTWSTPGSGPWGMTSRWKISVSLCLRLYHSTFQIN